jgi:hypothetical protein
MEGVEGFIFGGSKIKNSVLDVLCLLCHMVRLNTQLDTQLGPEGRQKLGSGEHKHI